MSLKFDSKIKFSYRSEIDTYDKINSRFKCFSASVIADSSFPYHRIAFYAGKRNDKENWNFRWDPNKIDNKSMT